MKKFLKISSFYKLKSIIKNCLNMKKIVEKQICLDICFYYNPNGLLCLNYIKKSLNSLSFLKPVAYSSFFK